MAMANTLTNLIPDIYAALDVVSRESTGFIPSVLRDSSVDRVAIGQTLRVPVTPANTAGGNFSAAMSLPSAADQTISNASLTITQQRYFPFSWSGAEARAMDAGGPGFLTLKQQQIYQALRAARNEMESDIALAAKRGASRAYGSAATTPFGTAGDFSDAAQVRRILDDNGAPTGDRSLVVNTAAGANLRAKQGVATVQTDPALLRQGILLDINGFAIRESAQIALHTKGTANVSASTNDAGYAIGDTTITLKSAGTGTIVSGDIVSHARDTNNKYVVKTGDADISNGGTIVLNAPGVRETVTAADSVLTLTGNYTPNIAFSRNAIVLATRLPDMPAEGDLARDSIVVTDPVTGLSFEIRYYPGVGMGVYYVLANWGVSVIKPEHVAILIG
jgi:hypothetical protein